ncbi:hypothetical protein [Edaphobacter sp.]|uniref:hypothetical protein n=1 Tax=Edaphobacter sp. TaxID=1934404 RepID=UPI002DBD425A|nr:hypothetical protein [Edaphobacter sp.]HEU5340699.1 hypothetical protein [Edaphobacter sp.]
MKLFKSVVLSVAVAVSATPMFADFSYTETTQMTGGSLLGVMKMAGHFSRQAREAGGPIVTTVTVKGNRMSRVSPTSTEIIDLDAETITNIDTQRREYTVMTFQQMKQQIEAAEAKAAAEQKKAPAEQQQSSNTKVDFVVHVRNTGQSKEVSGLSTSESIMTMNMNATDTSSGQTGSMAFTNDMWMAPEVPGYDEMKEFYQKFAQKMGTVFSSSAINPAMLAQYKGASQGLRDMAEEMSKLKGTPILQVMRMGTTANGQTIPAASEAPLPQSQSPSAGDVAKESATDSIASKLGGLGGFGGFGHKKQQPKQDSAQANSGSGAQPAYAVLMETNTQMGNFSRTASDASFAIPAGFKQIPVRGVN